jgi:hypothetical protein
MGSYAQVAPGDYDVEAYDLNPESEKVAAALDQAVEQARQENKVGYRLAIAHRLLAVGGLLHIVTFIAVAILAIFFFSNRRAGWLLLEGHWGWLYGALGVVWVLRFGLGFIPAVRAFYRAVNIEAEQHPLTVVILTRRTTPPESWQGVAFGEIDLPSNARPRCTVP